MHKDPDGFILTKKIRKIMASATLMTWGSFFIKAINAVLIIPFILSKFSAAEVSVWLLFAVVAGLLNLADMGFTQSFSRAISYAFGGGTHLDFKNRETAKDLLPNWELIRKIMKVMDKVYLRLSLLAFVVIVSIGTLLVYKPIAALEDNKLYWMAWAVIVAVTPLLIYGIKYSTYLVGINKIALAKRLDIAFSSISICTTLAIIIFKPSILAIVANTQFWLLANVVRDYVIIRRDKNIKGYKTDKYDKDIFAIIWNSSWRTALGLLASYGVVQFTGVFYTQVSASTEAVASYLLSLKIMMTIVDFSRAPFYSRLPGLSILRAQGKTGEFFSSAKKGMRITLGIFTLAVITVGCLNKQILELIHSKTAFVDTRIWALMSLGFFLERYGSLHLQFYTLTNKIIWHTVNVVTGSVTLLVMFLGYRYLGVYVFPVALLASNILFYTWYSAWHSYKEFQMNFWRFEKGVALLPFFALVAFMLFSFFI